MGEKTESEESSLVYPADGQANNTEQAVDGAGHAAKRREIAATMRTWPSLSAAGALFLLVQLGGCAPSDKPDNLAALQDIQEHRSGDEVTIEGTVAQVLRTSTSQEGRHERFMLDVHTGSGDEQLILVAHNIDIAPQVPLQVGDDVTVRGQLEIDRNGPVLHWTHHDPRARHQPGFIRVHGQTYD